MSILEAVAPSRLGVGFRWLLASSWFSNLGDGIALAAGPLLVASQTDDEFLVALAAGMAWAPSLLFGLLSGVVTDRVDRRLIVMVADLVRVGVLALLVTAIATEAVSISLVLVALFLLGTAEVFADNASQVIMPMLVEKVDLGTGQARLQTSFVTVNQLAGPPLGAALFAAGHTWPFAGQAILVGLAAVLVSRIALPELPRAGRTVAGVGHDVAEAFRWVWQHGAVRTLTITIFIFNTTFGAAWSVLVLYATRRLGLEEIGFGLITTVSAVGGLVGTLGYGWITRRISPGDVMRIGLVIETLTHVALALARSPWVAMPVFFVFGAHAFIWHTTSVTVRQRAVPNELQGRVNSVNLLGVFGGLVIGSALGGALARQWGVTAPFWWGFAGSAVFLVLIWRQLRQIDEEASG